MLWWENNAIQEDLNLNSSISGLKRIDDRVVVEILYVVELHPMIAKKKQPLFIFATH